MTPKNASTEGEVTAPASPWVDMTIMHDPPNAIGNCFPACIASVLGLPLDDVPHFCEPVKGWERRFHRWLAERDLFALEASLKVPDSLFLSPRTLCILTGDSPRGRHAVVGRVSADADCFEYVHDPHPSRGFYGGKEPDQVMFIGRVVRDNALEAELAYHRTQLTAANEKLARVAAIEKSQAVGHDYRRGYNACREAVRKIIQGE